MSAKRTSKDSTGTKTEPTKHGLSSYPERINVPVTKDMHRKFRQYCLDVDSEMTSVLREYISGLIQ